MKTDHGRRCPLEWSPPEPPFHLVLVHPKIPPNTGTVARLCAATASRLHLVRPLGFKLTDRSLRRAGLDYWDALDVAVHESLDACLSALAPRPCWFFSTSGPTCYFDAAYEPGCALVFGSETRGLPDDLLARYPERTLSIPIDPDRVRSLNLAAAASCALYEALRQNRRRTTGPPEPLPFKDSR